MNVTGGKQLRNQNTHKPKKNHSQTVFTVQWQWLVAKLCANSPKSESHANKSTWPKVIIVQESERWEKKGEQKPNSQIHFEHRESVIAHQHNRKHGQQFVGFVYARMWIDWCCCYCPLRVCILYIFIQRKGDCFIIRKPSHSPYSSHWIYDILTLVDGLCDRNVMLIYPPGYRNCVSLSIQSDSLFAFIYQAMIFWPTWEVFCIVLLTFIWSVK